MTTSGAKLLAMVDTVDDALPVLVDYHEKRPTKVTRDSLTKYSRDTPFGLLRIEKKLFPGVSRCGHHSRSADASRCGQG